MSVASLLITVKPPRVRGFIYVGAGLPALSVWAQKPQFTNQIQWIFSISIIFGHRQSFLKNCSPWPVPFWAQQRFLQEKFQLSLERKENISSKHAACAQYRSIAIETIVSVFYISSPVPKCRESMGNISEKSVPVPKRPGRATIIPIQIQGHAAQAQVLSFRLMRQPPLIAR